MSIPPYMSEKLKEYYVKTGDSEALKRQEESDANMKAIWSQYGTNPIPSGYPFKMFTFDFSNEEEGPRNLQLQFKINSLQERIDEVSVHRIISGKVEKEAIKKISPTNVTIAHLGALVNINFKLLPKLLQDIRDIKLEKGTKVTVYLRETSNSL